MNGGHFMVIFFIVLGMIIALLVLTIKYFTTYARVASHKSYDEEAKKRAAKQKYEDPVITCDFCGAKIDTRTQKTCPKCGAEYAADKEWLERHDPDAVWIDVNSKDTASEEVKRARAKAKKIAKNIRIIIYILAGGIVLMLILALINYFIGTVAENSPGKFIENEVLNEYSYEHFVPEEYGFDTEPVIFQLGGVKATVEGIYKDSERNDIKIGYRIENTTDQPLDISFSRDYLNRFERWSYIGGWVPANSSVIVYEWIYKDAPEVVKSLSFTGFKVYAVGRTKIYNGAENDYSTVTTNAEFDETPVLPEEQIAFENEKVAIAVRPLDEDARSNAYSFWVYNKTGNAMYMDLPDYILINDEKCEVSGIYKELIPAGCVHTRGDARSYDKPFTELKDSDIVRLSFSFTSEEDPSLDFSTGYFELKR